MSRAVVWLRPVFAAIAIALSGAMPAVAADRCATDALDRNVCLPAPARRVVSLSPGATELLYSAGAGGAVVAASAWSDYPPPARDLPRVGDANRLDLEAIVAARPDLIVAWTDGNSRSQLERLSDLGLTVFWLTPRTFDDIARAVVDLGQLTGHDALARDRANRFLAGLAALRDRYRNARPVRVFYQIWDEPLMTVNRDELISKSLALCGAVNVFADADRLVPRVSRESVLLARPEAILTAAPETDAEHALAAWRAFPDLPAVAHDNLLVLPPDRLQRPTLRMLDGARDLCQRLEAARGRL